MDVRIGVTHTVKEIDIDLPADANREKIKKSIDEAIGSEDKVLWLTDRHGREFAVPSGKIAYVELGGADSSRRVGFGAG